MWLGTSQGYWLGSWDGALSSPPPGNMLAALSGAAELTATASAAAYLTASLSGMSDVLGDLINGDVTGQTLYWHYAHSRGRR